MAAWRVLYTKQLQKKHKTYHDGFVVVRDSGAVALLDDSGHELAAAAAPLPAEEDWARCEGVGDVFPGFLVNGDEECAPYEVPGFRGGDANGPAAAAAAAAPAAVPAPTAARNPMAPAARQAFKRSALSAGGGATGAGGAAAGGQPAAVGWGGATHSSAGMRAQQPTGSQQDQLPVGQLRQKQHQHQQQKHHHHHHQAHGGMAQPLSQHSLHSDSMQPPCLRSGAAGGRKGPEGTSRGITAMH
jgi:hypothetical protein